MNAWSNVLGKRGSRGKRQIVEDKGLLGPQFNIIQELFAKSTYRKLKVCRDVEYTQPPREIKELRVYADHLKSG